jgi:hypothetical protein
MTTTEARAHDELRDRLDHMRRVADARGRVHAFIEAYGRVLEWKPVLRADGAVLRIDGTKVALQVGDLRVLLDGEFTPTRDTKRPEPRCICPRDHLGMVGENPGDCPIHPLPGCPNTVCGETWVEAFHGVRCDSCGWVADDDDETGLHREQAQAMRAQAAASYARSKGSRGGDTYPTPAGWDRV